MSAGCCETQPAACSETRSAAGEAGRLHTKVDRILDVRVPRPCPFGVLDLCCLAQQAAHHSPWVHRTCAPVAQEDQITLWQSLASCMRPVCRGRSRCSPDVPTSRPSARRRGRYQKTPPLTKTPPLPADRRGRFIDACHLGAGDPCYQWYTYDRNMGQNGAKINQRYYLRKGPPAGRSAPYKLCW